MSAPAVHRYSIPSSSLGGWCVVYIEPSGLFTAHGDYGTFGHFWGSHGCSDIREFILESERDPHYFVRKFAQGRPEEYGGEQTEKDIKTYILEQRRHGGWTREVAAEEWRILKRAHIAEYRENFTDWYNATKIDCAGEFMREQPNADAVMFVERVMPQLCKLIRAELAHKEVA